MQGFTCVDVAFTLGLVEHWPFCNGNIARERSRYEIQNYKRN